MKRKTSTLPTRILSYGAQPPVAGEKLVREQLWLAHRYYNKLIEIELERRRLYREARSALDGAVAACEAAVADLTAAIDKRRGELQSKRQGLRTRAADPAATAALRALQTQRRAATVALQEARAATKTDPALMAVAERIQEQTTKKVHAARAASGVHWGTYLKVEESVQAACSSGKGHGDPGFKRWSGGGGRIAVQLQGRPSLSDIFRGDDTRIQFLPHGTPNGPWWSKSGLHAIVRIRVGSDEKKKPIWAEFPVLLHRLPPADAILTWAWILVRKQGPNFEYRLQLVVESAGYHEHRRGTGAIGMDLGWRQLPDGDIRVGYLVEDDTGEGRELRIPRVIPDALNYADKLRGYSDKHFDIARAVFQSWLAAQTGPAADWWREETRFMHQWRAHPKLARVAQNALSALCLGDRVRELWGAWSAERRQSGRDLFDTHEAIDAWLAARGVTEPTQRIALYLEWWRRKDRHLYEWECNQRAKALRRRKDIYRNIAAELAARYETLVLEKFDLRAFTKNPKPEDEVTDFSHKVRNRASPSELRLAILGAWAKDRTVPIPARNSTRECHLCHHVNETWGMPDALIQTCSGCAAEWDQDDNAARVLLHRWRERSGDDDTPGGSRSSSPDAGFGGTLPSAGGSPGE